MRSGPGAARTLLLCHIISARPSKKPLVVRTFLKVYMELDSYFLFLQEQIKDIIIRGEGDNRGHVLRVQTTSRGLCGLVCPSRTVGCAEMTFQGQ